MADFCLRVVSTHCKRLSQGTLSANVCPRVVSNLSKSRDDYLMSTGQCSCVLGLSQRGKIVLQANRPRPIRLDQSAERSYSRDYR